MIFFSACTYKCTYNVSRTIYSHQHFPAEYTDITHPWSIAKSLPYQKWPIHFTSIVLQQPPLHKAQIFPVTDNNMIQHLNPHDVTRLFESSCNRNIFIRWSRISGWMLM